MKTNLPHFRSSSKGFTLIEVLVVIAIVAVIAGFGFGTFFLINKNSKVKQAEVMIEFISTSLETKAAEKLSEEDLADLGAVIDSGERYPNGTGSANSSKDLYAYLSGDYDKNGKVDPGRTPAFKQMDPEYTGKGKYLNKENLIIDPWKTPIRYEYPGDKNNVEDGYDIWSAGPDKKFDTEDDVTNW